MGNIWYLQLDCAYCGKRNPNPDEEPDSGNDTSSWAGVPGIYYAPSSNVTTFKCWNCGKENSIVQDFMAKKIEEEDNN